MSKDALIDRLRVTHSEINGLLANELLTRANDIAMDILYPFSESTRPDDLYDTHGTWLIRAAEELYGRLGIEGGLTYSENGLSIAFDNASISLGLIRMLTPKAAIPWTKNEDDEEDEEEA